jgi:hypothetical protein
MYSVCIRVERTPQLFHFSIQDHVAFTIFMQILRSEIYCNDTGNLQRSVIHFVAANASGGGVIVCCWAPTPNEQVKETPMGLALSTQFSSNLWAGECRGKSGLVGILLRNAKNHLGTLTEHVY